jgi:hypothetical protein
MNSPRVTNIALKPCAERRELAHRSNDGIEVTLFWTKSTDTVTLVVLDARLDETLEFDVDRGAALDAFKHPYVYAAGRMLAGPALTQPPVRARPGADDARRC